MRHPSVWTALAFLIACGTTQGDQANSANAMPSSTAIASAPTPPPVAVYLNQQAIGVQADFGPFRAYFPCQPPPPNSHLSPFSSNACRGLVAMTNTQLTKSATTILGGAVKAAIATGFGGATSPITILPLPQDYTGMGKSLGALPFMERRAALVAVDLHQQVHVDYQGQVQNGATTQFSFTRLITSIGHRAGPMVFDGTAKVTYSAKYSLYSVDTGQLLRTGTVGPISMDTAPFHAQWYFEPAHIGFNMAPWTAQDLEAEGRIQDPRVKLIATTFKAMIPQVEAASEASLKDWPQVVQAAQELLAGQH